LPAAVAEPFDPPLQETETEVGMEAVTAVGCVIVTLAVAVHKLASETVTVKVPAANPVFVAVAEPLESPLQVI